MRRREGQAWSGLVGRKKTKEKKGGKKKEYFSNMPFAVFFCGSILHHAFFTCISCLQVNWNFVLQVYGYGVC
jgi:hypothetical protein